MKRPALYVSIAFCILLFAGTAGAVSPVETAHFRVVANGQGLKTQDLKDVGDSVEGIYKEVSEAVGTGYTSSGKIEIRVYVTPKNGRALRTAASASTIFLTLGRIDEGVLKHEITHILISKPLSTAPRWFHEGLAMYVENGDMKQVYHKSLPDFTDFSFTRLGAKFGTGKTEQSSYLYAWAIVSYVMDTYGKDKLKDIYKQSGSFSDKFTKAFGVDLKTLEKKASEIFAAYK